MDRVVFGCAAQALYVIDNLKSRGEPAPSALVDIEAGANVGAEVLGVPVKWTREAALAALKPRNTLVIVAIGNNAKKHEVVEDLAKRGFGFFSAVHSAAQVSSSVTVADGCIVNAGAVVLPRATLQAHAIVHSGAVVEHDCVIGEGANIAPGAALAGRVQVGAWAYVYTGASVAPRIRIGAGAIVGAGAVVIRDVPDGVTVVGNPARVKP